MSKQYVTTCAGRLVRADVAFVDSSAMEPREQLELVAELVATALDGSLYTFERRDRAAWAALAAVAAIVDERVRARAYLLVHTVHMTVHNWASYAAAKRAYEFVASELPGRLEGEARS